MSKLKDQLLIQGAGTNSENNQVLISDTPQVTIIEGPAPEETPALKAHQRIDVKVSRGPGGQHKSVEPAARISLVGGRPKVMRATNHDKLLWLDRVLSIGGQKTFSQVGIHISDDDAIRIALECLEGLCSTYALKFFGTAPKVDDKGQPLSDEAKQAIATRRVGVYKGLLEYMRKQVDAHDDMDAFDQAAEFRYGL